MESPQAAPFFWSAYMILPLWRFFGRTTESGRWRQLLLDEALKLTNRFFHCECKGGSQRVVKGFTNDILEHVFLDVEWLRDDSGTASGCCGDPCPLGFNLVSALFRYP